MKRVCFISLILMFVAWMNMANLTFASRRGYSMGFQAHSIAGTRQGFIDFTDPGWSNFDDTFTISFWMRQYVKGYALTIAHPQDPTWFAPIWMGKGLLFGKQWDIDVPFLQWTYCTITSAPGSRTRLYFNGIEHTDMNTVDSKFQVSDKLAITIGNHLYSFHDGPLPISKSKMFIGEIDDVTIWSRELSSLEIKAAMEKPLSATDLAADASILVYYNFDSQICETDAGDVVTTNRVMADDCDAQHVRVVPNLGSTGSRYDLLIGQMDNQFGYGKHFEFNTGPGFNQLTRFELPLPTLSVPDDEGFSRTNLDAPSVYHIMSGDTIVVNLNATGTVIFTVKQLPINGTLYVSENDADPVTSDETSLPPSTTQVYYKAPVGMVTPDKFTLDVEIDGGAKVPHEVHIWPYLPPILKKAGGAKSGLTTVEDNPISTSLTLAETITYSRPPGVSQAKVTQTVSNGELYWEYSSSADVLVSANSTASTVQGSVKYIPKLNSYGRNADSFQYLIIDPRSGYESLPLDVSIEVLESNDKPYVVEQSVTLDEDSGGIEIQLEAGDYEPNSVALTIASLPQKGDLFVLHPTGADGESEWMKVTTAYELYRIEETFESYARDIVTISSFWGVAPSTSYHPMGVLGRPSCASKFGECVEDERYFGDWTLQVGDIVHVDQSNASNVILPSLQVVGDVVAVHGTGKTARYDVKVKTMYKNDGASYPNLTPCYLDGSLEFPSACSPALYSAHGGNLVLENVHPEAFYPSKNAVHAPLNVQYSAGAHYEGGDASAAFGLEYYYDHHPSDYWDNSKPQYDEFFEVRFAEPAYMVDLEVGEPRGGGSIVAIKAKNPDGNWDLLYSGRPLIEEHEETTANNIYHWFSKQLCRPSYKVDHIRFELETLTIADYNYFDYIQRTATRKLQPAALVYGNHTVKYVPHKNQEGQDSFTVKSYDCGGSRLRGSEEATIDLTITPLPDAPSLNIESSEDSMLRNGGNNKVELRVRSQDVLQFNVTAFDVDVGDSVTVYFTSTSGSLESDGLYLTAAALAVEESVQPSSLLPFSIKTNDGGGVRHQVSSLQFHAGLCHSLVSRTVSLLFSGVDTSNRETELVVRITIECNDLEKAYEFDEISHGAKSVSTGLGATGLIMSLIAMAFNIRYRKLPAVKFTSPKINIVLLIGTMMVYGSLVMTGGILRDNASCDPESFVEVSTCVNNTAGDQCCASETAQRCILPVAISVIGITTTFGTLIGKTDRIIKLMLSNDLKVRIMSDKSVGMKAAMIVAPAALLLVVWYSIDAPTISFHHGTPELHVASQTVIHKLSPQCTSVHGDMFFAGLVGYIGLIICYGAVQAYKVRHVSIKQANDAASIAISLYNIFVFGAICLALNFTVQRKDPKHVLTTVLIWLATTITILALFGMRAYEVSKGEVTVSSSSYSKQSGKVVDAGAATTRLGANTTQSTVSRKDLAP